MRIVVVGRLLLLGDPDDGARWKGVKFAIQRRKVLTSRYEDVQVEHDRALNQGERWQQMEQRLPHVDVPRPVRDLCELSMHSERCLRQFALLERVRSIRNRVVARHKRHVGDHMNLDWQAACSSEVVHGWEQLIRSATDD